MAAQFHLLGDVEVRIDDRPISIGYRQLRTVLAVLLIEANRTVSVEALVDRVWGDRPLPRRPRAAVQHSVTLLRAALADVDEVTISWRSTGYQLTVAPQTVDVHRFRELLSRAHLATDDEVVVALLGQALELWRGDPFTSLDTPWLNNVRAALTEQRHNAQLDLIDLLLRRGQHATLLAELTERATQHPLDERLTGQYLLALYRCGRQAEALEHYLHLRERLAEQLGTDPSPPLQMLYQRILDADPELAVTTSASTPDTRRALVPRQLPGPPRLFTGRTRELNQLTAALNPTGQPAGMATISAIGGAGGMGKTWLALHWAHQHLDRFPDGQLHVNLGGFDASGTPMTPATAVRGFLDAFGVDPVAIPAETQAQVGLYRSLVAGRRMLIMLDNAADSTQVIPLLPGSPTCTVLVTSRRRLTGLITAHGAAPINLDVLPETDARELLVSHLDADRLTAEPEAVTELLSLCAGLPLALAIVAARAASRPDLPLLALADELRDSAGRLDALNGDDPATNLRTVLSGSYRALSPSAATLFELLGLAPGPDVGLPAAANLLGRSSGQTRTILRELEDAHLVHQHSPGRYRMHDLVRLYAADQADHGGPADSHEALRRLIDFYLHAAFAADHLLDPHRQPIPAGTLADGPQHHVLDNKTAALTWFTAEHANLLAAQDFAAERGWYRQTWQIAWTLNTFQYRQGYRHDALRVWRAALTAAEQTDDLATRTQVRRLFGHACARAGHHDEALEHLEQTLAIAEDSEDRLGQAHIHHTLGWVWENRGDARRALRHADTALRLFRTLHVRVWEARTLNDVGWCHARLGHHEHARVRCERALTLARRHHDREGTANALDSLGFLAYDAGWHELALDYYQQALTLLRELGHTYYEANTLDRLAHTHHALGQPEPARTAWRQALRSYRAQHRSVDAARVQQNLAQLGPADG